MSTALVIVHRRGPDGRFCPIKTVDDLERNRGWMVEALRARVHTQR